MSSPFVDRAEPLWPAARGPASGRRTRSGSALSGTPQARQPAVQARHERLGPAEVEFARPGSAPALSSSGTSIDPDAVAPARSRSSGQRRVVADMHAARSAARRRCAAPRRRSACVSPFRVPWMKQTGRRDLRCASVLSIDSTGVTPTPPASSTIGRLAAPFGVERELAARRADLEQSPSFDVVVQVVRHQPAGRRRARRLALHADAVVPRPGRSDRL